LGIRHAVPAERLDRLRSSDGRTFAVYELTVKGHFDAAHSLREYPGECRNLHGHTWDVEVMVGATEVDEIGIVYDFKHLKDDLNRVIGDYDHVYINEVPPFDEISPTAENLARVIYDRLAAIVDPKVHVAEVSVWESPIAKLTYRPGK
jgi:6-pyruvoyltetrahydropterin/6-carboxytetrahydropterin synthase